MFTGIITDIGVISSIEKTQDTRIVITTNYNLDKVDIGASIACSGVCLTVIEKTANSFVVEASDETLSCTTVKYWQPETKVNLEQALKAGDALGGHYVSGHVDGLATLISIKEIEGSHILTFAPPPNFSRYIAAKGSITLDGVSLTVNQVNNQTFTVNIISHTWQNTTLGTLAENDVANMEIDMIARYVERMVNAA